MLKVIVSVEPPGEARVAGLKALPIVGGTGAAVTVLTVKVATAGPALLPLLVVKAPTAERIDEAACEGRVHREGYEQEPAAGMVPPVRLTVEVVVEAVPPQVLVTVPAERPAGNESVKLAPVAAVALALLKVMVRVELPPALMEAGLKALATVGGTGPADALQVETATWLESRVTAPFCASARPDMSVPVVRVML